MIRSSLSCNILVNVRSWFSHETERSGRSGIVSEGNSERTPTVSPRVCVIWPRAGDEVIMLLWPFPYHVLEVQ